MKDRTTQFSNVLPLAGHWSRRPIQLYASKCQYWIIILSLLYGYSIERGWSPQFTGHRFGSLTPYISCHSWAAHSNTGYQMTQISHLEFGLVNNIMHKNISGVTTDWILLKKSPYMKLITPPLTHCVKADKRWSPPPSVWCSWRWLNGKSKKRL